MLLFILASVALPVRVPLNLHGPTEISRAARKLSTGPPSPTFDLAACTALPTPPTPDTTLIVPEGECFKVASSASLTYKGIHVVGTLAIDTSAATALAPVHVSITAEYIFVEGVFSLSTPADAVVPSSTSTVEITLVEPSDPAVDNFVIESLKEPPAFEPESVGVKAFVVYGGQLIVHALPDSCPAWTRLLDVHTEPAPQPEEPSAPPAAPTGCTDDASFVPVRTSFEDAPGRAGWYTNAYGTLGFLTGDAADGSAFASVTARTRRWGGYLMLDVPTACLVAGERYHFVAKARVRNEADGQYTTTACAAGEDRCIKAKIDSASSGSEWLGRTAQQLDASWLQIEDDFEFSPEMLAADPTVRLTFYNPNEGEALEVDYVRLERAPAAAFPPAAPATCAELVRNGDAQLDEHFSWPWSHYGPSASALAVVNVDGAGQRALRSTGRTRDWHGPQQSVEPGCLQPGMTVAVSARVRLPADAACTLPAGADRSACAQLELRVAGATIGTEYDTLGVQTEWVAGAWNKVEGAFTLRDHHDAALVEAATLRLQVRDDGANAWAEWDDVSVAFVSGPVRTLELNAAVSPCWAPGAELLVTSHTLAWADAQTARVESVSVSLGAARVRLDRSIARPTTLADSADFAVEVALLDRNVVVQGAADTLDGARKGGHLMVLKTTRPQAVHGVLLRRMGQQGVLGRYPAHMHLCGAAPGTVWARNVVRDSHQRCVVLHGTDQAEVLDNVAFETKGHCFMLEDGGELGNTFARNLGASTLRVEQLIRAEETDDSPSTFWITNPDNTWVDNVAAGSASTGFWFEMRTRVRAPTRGRWLPDDYNPKEIPLRRFARNVAHSNGNDGLQTYPGAGYTPKPPPGAPHGVGARFEQMRSYRNRAAGMFFHNSAYLEVSGGVFADNDRGIDVDRAHTCRVDGTGANGVVHVQGVTALYDAQLGALGARGSSSRSHCHSASSVVIGVQLHTQRNGADSRLGTWLGGVHFARLSEAETGCTGARALGVDDEAQGYFDARTAVGALMWSPAALPPAHRINLCKEGSTTVPEQPDVAIFDVDGSLIGGTAGFVVSDTPRMTGLLTGCASVAGACAALCPGVCLRQLQYRTSSQLAAGTVLRITSATGAFVNVPPRPMEHDEDTPKEALMESTHASERSDYFATVPSGELFTAEFVGPDGVPLWPLFAQAVRIDEPGACSAGSTADSIALAAPAIDPSVCASGWALNAGFEQLDAAEPMRVPGWWHDGGGVVLGAETLADGSLNHFALSDERTSYRDGPLQWLDTRCLHAAEPGGTIALRARAQLYNVDSSGARDHADLPACFGSARSGCVRAELRIERTSSDGSPTEVDFAAQLEFEPNAWNLVAGELELSAELLDGADAVRILFEGPEAGVVLALDDVEVTYTPPASWPACPAPGGSLIIDGGFDDADSYGVPEWWRPKDPLDDRLVVVSAPGGNHYGRSFGRSDDDTGPTQLLNPACWASSPVGVYALRADVQLVDPAGGTPHCLDPAHGGDCPRFELRVTTAAADGTPQQHYFYAGALHGVTTLGAGWDLLAGTFEVAPGSSLAAAIGAGEAVEEVRVSIEEPEPGIEILADNVELKKLPPPACPAATVAGVVANGGFDQTDADGRPAGWEGRYGKPLLAVTDAERGSAVARSFGRTSTSQGPLARLAEGCHGLAAGDSLVVHAWVKIEAPAGGSAACSDGSSSRCIQCTRLSTDPSAGSRYRGCGVQITREAGVWSLLEAQITLAPDEADGVGEWELYFHGPEEHNNILIDDVWVGKLGSLLDAVA